MGELLDNFLKVYQLANFIKHSQAQQQLEQARLQSLNDERLYQQTLHDFQLGQHLEDLGATRVKPIQDIQPGFGADILEAGQKRQVTTPLGATYQVPTFQERQQQLLDMYSAKQMAEAGANVFQKRMEQQYTATPVQVRGLGPFGTSKTVLMPNTAAADYQRKLATDKDKQLTVPDDVAATLGIAPGKYTKDQLKVYEDQYNRLHKDENDYIVTGTDDNGVVTAAAIDRKTHTVTSLTIPGVRGKTKTVAGAGAGGKIPAAVQKIKDDFEAAKQTAVDEPDMTKKETMKKQLAARAKALNISNPAFEGGVGTDGWAYLNIKEKQPIGAAAKAAATKSTGVTITRSDYSKGVRQFGKAAMDAELKRRGWTIIE